MVVPGVEVGVYSILYTHSRKTQENKGSVESQQLNKYYGWSMRLGAGWNPMNCE